MTISEGDEARAIRRAAKAALLGDPDLFNGIIPPPSGIRLDGGFVVAMHNPPIAPPGDLSPLGGKEKLKPPFTQPQRVAGACAALSHSGPTCILRWKGSIVRFRSSVLSECGPTRPINADAVIADDETGFYGVADGIGSARASAEASAWALTLAYHHFQALRHAAHPMGLAPLFAAVRRDYHGRFGVGVDIPGTTLSVAAVMDGALHCLNVGDSPIFALLEDTAVLLSSRHTVADRDRVVDDVWLMKALPRSNILDNYLGRVSVEPRLRPPIPLSHGVRVMLCSDGLLEVISHVDLVVLHRQSPSPMDFTAAIAARSAHLLARDNYSVVVADIDPFGAAQPDDEAWGTRAQIRPDAALTALGELQSPSDPTHRRWR